MKNMKEKLTILPEKATDPTQIQYVESPGVLIATTSGLVKQENEDRVSCSFIEEHVRICVVDGHWGDSTAEDIVRYWNRDFNFPSTRKSAILQTKQLEKELFMKYGKEKMDEDKDFTPEAGFVVLEVRGAVLKLISYGDCRLLVCGNGETRYELETKQTWLGAFSHLGLRQRQDVDEGLIYDEIELKVGDTILAYSDGIDECEYEKQVLTTSQLSAITKTRTQRKAVDAIFKLVFEHGAEDNASLALIVHDQLSRA